MSIEALNVEIIDTAVNDRDLIVENTALSAPRIVVDAASGVNRYNVIRGSQLNFNCLVKTNAEAVFYHLYTGNETRYKVVLSDITDTENPVVLWEGFLLPEQFTEPYTYSNYFVEFLATDGLGRLKGKEMAPTFYQEEKSVSQILAECLQNTGLSYPMAIAPAIANSILDLKLSDLNIDTTCYTEQEEDKLKKKDVYTVLSEVLKALGCSIVQWMQKWYIIGINRQKEVELVVENYSTTGAYINTTSVFRNVVTPKFVETPTITLLPPFKQVILNWDKAAKENLLPLDVVKEDVPVLVVTSKYWNLTTDSGLELFLDNVIDYDIQGISYNQNQMVLHYNTSYLVSPNIPRKEANPYILGSVATTSDLKDNYITLKNDFCINKRRNETVTKTTFTLKAYVVANNVPQGVDIQQKLEDGDFNNTFYYGVTYKPFKTQTDFLIFPLTNQFLGGQDNKIFNPKISVETRGNLLPPLVKFEVEIENLPINLNGYYNVRLYPLVNPDAVLADTIYFTDLEWTFPAQSTEVVTKTRNIDFTSIKEETIFHGDSEMELTNRKFIIDPDTLIAATVSGVENTIALERLYFNTFDLDTVVNGVTYNVSETTYYGISQEMYNLLLEPTTQLFIQKDAIGDLRPMQGDFGVFNGAIFNGAYNGPYVTQQVVEGANVPLENQLKAGDKLYIKTNQTQNYQTADYAEFAAEKWKRYDVASESLRYVDALARVYHDAVKNPRFVISGTSLGLVTPLDLLSFDYKGQRNYQSTRLEINYSTGKTIADWVEVTQENVTDYAAE